MQSIYVPEDMPVIYRDVLKCKYPQPTIVEIMDAILLIDPCQDVFYGVFFTNGGKYPLDVCRYRYQNGKVLAKTYNWTEPLPKRFEDLNNWLKEVVF